MVPRARVLVRKSAYAFASAKESRAVRKAVSPVPEAASTTAAIAGLSMPNFDSSFT